MISTSLCRDRSAGENPRRPSVRPRLAPALLSVLGLAGACAKEPGYSGDGRLIDHGWTAADTRYVVELGPIDLTRAGTALFKMTGIPRTYFVVGLRIPGRVDRGSAGNAPTSADVSLEVIQENYGMVALVTAPLREWTWIVPGEGGSAFAYLRRSSQSYFDAFTEARYQLKVAVNRPDPSIPAGTMVVLQSAGWK